jgi:16S rRNA processing protein RimM
MAYNTGILLGKIIKSYGFDGTVAVKLEKVFDGKVPEMESVFLESEGKPVPFLVSSCEIVDNTLIRITFDGYNSLQLISEFIGCRIYLTSSVKPENSGNDPNPLTGYQVRTTENDIVGTISEIIENPGQNLLDIQTSRNKKILIPFHQDFIVRVDNKKKIITMDLPEGLTEIND